MKILYFIILYFCIFIQDICAQNECNCLLNDYCIIQDWKPYRNKDSLVSHVILSSHKKDIILCTLYKNGKCFSIRVPHRGEWRIRTMTNINITLWLKRKMIVYDLISKKFSEIKLITIEPSPHDPHGQE